LEKLRPHGAAAAGPSEGLLRVTFLWDDTLARKLKTCRESLSLPAMACIRGTYFCSFSDAGIRESQKQSAQEKPYRSISKAVVSKAGGSVAFGSTFS